MINVKYKKILSDIFDILNLSKEDRASAIEGFKKKLGHELLKATQDCLTEKDKEWIKGNRDPRFDDPEVLRIRKVIQGNYSSDELKKMGDELFKKILATYIEMMSFDLNQEVQDKLKKVLNNL